MGIKFIGFRQRFHGTILNAPATPFTKGIDERYCAFRCFPAFSSLFSDHNLTLTGIVQESVQGPTSICNQVAASEIEGRSQSPHQQAAARNQPHAAAIMF